MKQHLLIFTWEYYGYHSKQGTALSKRPKQVAESFINNGWDVTVIHKDQINECGDTPYRIVQETPNIKRISVKQNNLRASSRKNTIIRKLETLYYTAFRGDRSYRWAQNVKMFFPEFNMVHPSLIISFFTPRAPLFLGYYYSRQLNSPWIADLQDPVDEGISKESMFLSWRWMKKILRSATSVVQVSPEWATQDAKKLNRKVDVIRHAVVEKVPYNIANSDSQLPENTFKIFYGGSVNPGFQSLELVEKVLYSLHPQKKIKFYLAGNSFAYDYFTKALGKDKVEYLGWITAEQISEYIYNCDCTLLIACSKLRPCIPSKFYELCAYDKPMWIIGDDIGSFESLLNEWKHPQIGIDNLAFQELALQSAINGNNQYMFNVNNCKGEILKAAGLYHSYISLI